MCIANFTHFIQILSQSTLKHFNNQKVLYLFLESFSVIFHFKFLEIFFRLIFKLVLSHTHLFLVAKLSTY